MNSTLRWIVAIAGSIVLLIIFGIWKSLDKEIGTSIMVGGIRGGLLGSGIFFIYQWAKNNPERKNLKSYGSTTKEQHGPSNLDYCYKIVAEEIKNKKIESGLLARAIAEGGGDKEKSQSIYIKLRAGELSAQYNRESKFEFNRNKLKNREELLNNIGKYIYGFIFYFLILSIISTLLIFLSNPISDNSFFGLLPILLIVLPTVIAYKKFKENSTTSKKPTPDTHVRCPDCRELVPKESSACNYCGCKLIPQ